MMRICWSSTRGVIDGVEENDTSLVEENDTSLEQALRAGGTRGMLYGLGITYAVGV